ncbi:3-oxoacyl-[acyl-carrier protein] reductase [Gracilibacillus halotolerans]|uniref:3-oxoacyl-[acyl-carrier protein] reductase n=1 Tax=Gracilibacillus halotolerans TaxID=74386 RepID=A0A841RNB6_9BACI|nr:3-oxoacyl-ACP reductase [Gracilibacillus halotolerans]MBB6512444.1 3-oxoacyl-[acyl-carrier protein] reductase [Gracilibacillus halotolerans]
MKIPELEGKTVFVTGANSGIGRAQAIVFLKNGANVFGFDIQDQGLKELQQANSNFYYEVGSVADKEAVSRAVESAVDSFGKIDILLNTAGILDGYAPTLDTDEALWDKVMDTNVKGMYLVTNAVLPYMLKQNKGTIINVASIAGLVAGGGGAAYTASKHAIIGYTKQLAYDYSRKGIRANAIAPGAIKTPMNQADFEGDGKMADWVAEETPAGRWAEAEEVANVTLFLASDAAGYMHGSVLPIDGGWIIK